MSLRLRSGLAAARALHFGLTVGLLLAVAAVALADEPADRAAIEAASQAWAKAFNSRDVEGLLALATPDVMLMDPDAGAPVNGREAARAAWARAVGLGLGDVATSTREIRVIGDIAWRTSALARSGANGAVLGRSQSLEIWKRVNGDWKMHRQMSSGLLSQVKPRRLPSEPVLDVPPN